VVKIQIEVFWVVTPCIFFVHPEYKGSTVPETLESHHTTLHSITIQKTST